MADDPLPPEPAIEPATPPAEPAPAAAEPAPATATSLLDQKPEEKPQGAPEAYAEFKVPEGYTLDPEVAKEVTGIFKELNLTQEQSQRLVDFYTKQTQEAFDQPYRAYDEMRAGWRDEVKADPEIGGKLDQVKSTVAKAIDGLGDPKLAQAFRDTMNLTGAGDNLAFIKVVYKLAEMVTEGGHVKAGGPVGQRASTGRPASAAQAIYPDLK